MQRRCGCDCLAVQLMWLGVPLNSIAATGPEAALQIKALPTKKGRTNPSLIVPKTLPNDTN